MAKTKFVDFKAIKAAITMEQLLGHYHILDQFKRTGESLNGPCPIHKGSNPTQFRVSTTKNLWHCFSDCEHGGNALDFITKMEKCSIHAAALKAKKANPQKRQLGPPKRHSNQRRRKIRTKVAVRKDCPMRR
jgi:DNA primase